MEFAVSLNNTLQPIKFRQYCKAELTSACVYRQMWPMMETIDTRTCQNETCSLQRLTIGM